MRQQGRYNRDILPRRAGGFTLFEALLAVMLIGIAAVAFSSALLAGTGQNQAAVQYTIATDLATALMNEIVSRQFRDAGTPTIFSPGPGSDETTRLLWDNVDDYHGLTEAAGQLRGADGQLLSDASLAGFSRTATATYVTLPGQDSRYSPAFIFVTVEVKYNGVSMVTLKRLISSEERR